MSEDEEFASRPPIVVIAGATATGKTGAALKLAKALDCELVGADSVQVYRGFDIGSAKPSEEELDGIAHHLIDVVDPDEAIDAMDYARLADAKIEQVHERGRGVLVVGGTGLWIRALVRGLVDLPKVDELLRKRLEARWRDEGPKALHDALRAVDSASADKIHPNDQVRVVRALEVFEQTGTPISELRRKHALGAPRYPTLFIALTMDRSEHDAIVKARTKQMLNAGLLSEVHGLLERYPRELRPFGSVGYKEAVACLLDGVPLDETTLAIERATRVYARRQRTWFGGEPGVDVRATRQEVITGELVDRIKAHFGR